MADTMLHPRPFQMTEEREPDPAYALASAKKARDTNVGQAERLACILGGSVLAVLGLSRRSFGGVSLAALGGSLILRGTTGHCELYRTLKINTADTASETYGIHVEQAITINKTAGELYRFWHQFENLPHFMQHLESVTVKDALYSHWVAKAPMGQKVQWDAQIINDKPDEMIAWQSLPGADIENAGSVRFEAAPGGRGTEVHVTLQYYPPGGMVGANIAKIFGEEPSLQIADDLRRFKRLMETGEIATTEGQSNGKSVPRMALSPTA